MPHRAHALLLLLPLLCLPEAAQTSLLEESWEAAQSQPDCREAWASRRYLSPSESAALPSGCPALLWTFTGSGNTLARVLIEAASGLHTGSVYTDLSLIDLLPGEAACDSRTLAVKAHPQWHPWANITAQGMRPAVPGEPPDAKEVCECHFRRAIALIRDPYKVLVTEYQRHRTHSYETCSLQAVEGHACAGGHVAVIAKADFDAADFRKEAMRLAAEWAAMFDSYTAFEAANAGGLHWASWEALTDPARREAELRGILAFLGLPLVMHTAESSSSSSSSSTISSSIAAPPGSTGRHETAGSPAAAAGTASAAPAAAATEAPSGAVSLERLACAFALARHPSIYRPKRTDAIDAAYVYGRDPRLVCDVWAVLGAHAAEHGYRPYGGAECGAPERRPTAATSGAAAASAAHPAEAY